MQRPTYCRPIRVDGDIAFIPLTRGYEAVIDASDIPIAKDIVWTAATMKGGETYAVTSITKNGKDTSLRLHRLLLSAADGEEVDHVDRNPMNNRRSNLRFCDRTQNNANHGVRCDSGTGIKGVFRHSSGRFRAKIKHKGRQIHLGYFISADEAKAAYNEKARELFGDFFTV